MATQQKTKGNPASKRMTNERRKARRRECWARGQARKAERRAEQAERERKNRELREAGLPTPWEEAKAARREKRLAAVVLVA